MLHTIVDPMQVLLTENKQQVVCRRIHGCLCECVQDGTGLRVRRLLTTDLRDYLRPELQPGGPSGVTTELTLPARHILQ